MSETKVYKLAPGERTYEFPEGRGLCVKVRYKGLDLRNPEAMRSKEALEATDSAARTLKKMGIREGLPRDIARTVEFVPNTALRRRAKADACKRWQKKLEERNDEDLGIDKSKKKKNDRGNKNSSDHAEKKLPYV